MWTRLKKALKIKYSITVWMLASAFLLGALVVVYAAYSGTADVKRVVSTQASSGTAFSSNYMESGELVIKSLRTTAEGNFICNVTVCNYDQLDPASPAKAQITYSFKAELCRYDNSTGNYVVVSEVQTKTVDYVTSNKIFYVKKVMDNNLEINTDTEHSLNEYPYVFEYTEETLAGGTSNKDSFDVCFDSEEVDLEVAELFIRVTATPTEESMLQNSGVGVLRSIISVSKGRTVETGWYGSLDERTSRDYDGYNLVIEGSGAGTIDILWDNEKFIINPVFLTNNSLNPTDATSEGTGWKKVTLPVNSTVENRYVVQFYKKDEDTNYTGTEFPSKYIKCSNYQQTIQSTPTPITAP